MYNSLGIYIKDFISYYRDTCTCVATWMKRYSGIQHPKNTTSHSKQQISCKRFYWEGKIQKGDCLCSGEKQQGTEQNTGSYSLAGGGRVKFSRVKLSRVGIGGISNPEFRLFTL